VRSEDRVIGLNNGTRKLRGWIDAKLQLRLFAIVGGQTLKQGGSETRTSPTTEGMKNEEALKT
jgi:hypothetical protein